MSMVHIKQIKGTNALAKKDGSNASGTWPISIIGNATTATKANQDTSGNIIEDAYAKKTDLSSYQNKLTFDAEPTKDSTNPVTSDGIKKAIDKSSSDFLDGCTTETITNLWGTIINADTTTY